ncbi:MAG: hypothetical protein QOJ18_1439, partial [Microbacteriaceae bacterium]|nr:hypothetical protein [Microbacteriaceae bacterium]
TTAEATGDAAADFEVKWATERNQLR